MNFEPVGVDSKGQMYMKFHRPFNVVEKIQLLQRWIMVASVAYYDFDGNFIEDYKYDANARQLVDLMNKYPEEATRSRYHKYFYDYTGETGYHLSSRVERDDSDLYRHIRMDAIWALDLKSKYGNTYTGDRKGE